MIVVRSAARGVLGAMAMTGMRRVTTDLGLVEEPPPERIAKGGVPGLFARIAPEHRETAIELFHWGFGAVGGVGYGFLPAVICRRRWSGPAYGLVILGVFEAVIAPPLVLVLAACLDRWPRLWKMAFTSITVAVGLVSIDLAAVDHASRPPDEYRQAAQFVGKHVAPATPVVATGYLYLETVAVHPASAYPASQALHPGWRADPRDAEGSPLPAGAFIWIGEREAPEFAAIQRSRVVNPLFVNGRAMVAAVR